MIQETFTSHGDAKSIITKSNDEQLLDMAWEWLCRARKNAPPSADIWDLRLHWPQQRDGLLTQLKAGRYRLSAMWVVGKKKQAMWTARDALVLKWVALKLAGRLPLHPRCEHVKGHGGGAASLRRLNEVVHSGDYPWVCRTDIKGYYGAIQKPFLLEQLRQQRLAPEVLYLLEQYLHYSVKSGGEFHTPERGIPRGCALSPLMGALHLWAVDNHFVRQPGIYYARYMDDFVILTKTRWQLRRQVASLNRFFNVYGFRQHPDKTFIGRTAKGFDWMGAQLGASGVTGVAPRALASHWAKVRRLYEQTWLSRIMRQAKVSVYQARSIKWAIVALGVHAGSAGAVAVGEGLSAPIGSLRWAAAGQNALTSATRGSTALTGGALVATNHVGRDASCQTIRPLGAAYASIDGYTGLSLSPYVILVVSGTMTTRHSYTEGIGQNARYHETEDKMDLDDHGVATSQTAGPGYACFGMEIPAWGTVGAIKSLSRNVDLTYRVYVKRGSPAFTYFASLSYTSITGWETSAFSVSYIPATCTVDHPSTVNFGTITTVGAGSRTVPGRVGITCAGTTASVVSIRATSPTPAPGALGTVLADTVTGARMGVVTGYWGNTGAADCSVAPNAIYTDGRGTVVDPSFEGSVGTTRYYPVTWTLCPDRGAVPGPASGRMSLEATW